MDDRNSRKRPVSASGDVTGTELGRVPDMPDNTAPSDGLGGVGQSEIPGQFESSFPNSQLSPTQAYYASLRQWVSMFQMHAYTQQYMQNMMPYVMCAAYMQRQQQQQQQMPAASGAAPPQSLGGGFGGQQGQAQRAQAQQPAAAAAAGFGNLGQIPANVAQDANNIPNIPVLEFTVPPVYRRVIAEMIDFFLLFTAKLGIMLVIIDYLGISDTTGFMMRFLVEEIEDDTSLEELQQMLTFALVYRVIVCLYETFFLYSLFNRTLGGATPGKFVMGLRVISLEQVQTAGPGRVQVTLPDNVSFTQAILRAVVKNFSMAFFFPACVTVFFNPHFRAAYEVLTRTMVVGRENWPNAAQIQRARQQGLVR